MKLLDHIIGVFDDSQYGKHESALLHACIAVDATAKRLYPSTAGVKDRFIGCIRDYYWLVEPMVGVGINLVETTFENLGPPMFRTAPDLAEVIYYVHRCGHAHGDEIPIAFATRPTIGPVGSEWLLGPNILQMPHRIIWALASIAVFSRVNDGLRGSGGDRYLTWAKERYPIAEWWGREKDIRPIAAGWNTIRVKFDKLAALRMADPATGGMEFV